jgi:hypothetical protein
MAASGLGNGQQQKSKVRAAETAAGGLGHGQQLQSAEMAAGNTCYSKRESCY